MRAKGFTLLELMIVVIIIGVLGTVGIVQYQAAIEKSRGAEARQVIGQLRTQCAALYMQDPTGSGTGACNDTSLGIGGSIPSSSSCNTTHYFGYNISGTTNINTVTFRAQRCTSSGKSPNATTAKNVTLVTNYTNGSDLWSTDGGY